MLLMGCKSAQRPSSPVQRKSRNGSECTIQIYKVCTCYMCLTIKPQSSSHYVLQRRQYAAQYGLQFTHLGADRAAGRQRQEVR